MPVQNFHRNRERRLQRLLLRVVTRVISQFLSVYIAELYHGRNQQRSNLMHWRRRRVQATTEEDEEVTETGGEDEGEEDDDGTSANSSDEDGSINSGCDTARIYRSLRGNNFRVPSQRTLDQTTQPQALLHQPVARAQTEQERRHRQTIIQPSTLLTTEQIPVIPLNRIGFDEVDGASL